MTTEEMTAIILAYEKELDLNYKENRDAFGFSDKDTTSAFSKWFIIDELLERLNLKK